MEKLWYERWFREDYKSLYPHRDEAEALVQADALIRAVTARPSWRILDVGCGSGRHVQGFRKRGFSRAFGIDLSRVLLRDAGAAAADMRRLPFPDGAFDLLGCFFTSFGYLVTFEEDITVLREFVRVAKAGEFLFLDLHNPEHVARHLVPKDQGIYGGRAVEQERFLEEDCVVKRIRIRGAAGEKEEVHEERVRLFSLTRLEPVISGLGLSVAGIFGDERGGTFSPEFSPRMGLLLRRAP